MACLKTDREPCKECPWENGHKHSQDWQRYTAKMTEVGQIKDHVHACHMITVDTWGINSPISNENVCAGALKQKKQMTVEKREKILYIRVRMGNKEAEISYPLSERTQVTYDGSSSSTLVGAVKAVKDLIEVLKEE